MFAEGNRTDWLNAIASRIMDGGSSPPSIDHLNLIVPPMISTRESDGHCTAAAALGEASRKNMKAGWRVIVNEMVTILREQGFVGGNDQALTWIKPLDGTWTVTHPDDETRFTIFGQRERRMTQDRAIVGERSEEDGSRVGPPSVFETGRGHPLELDVIGPRGGTTKQQFGMHPLALIIPPMTEREREGLRTDIQRNGVKVPIYIYQKKILDGRNRAYLASVLNKPIKTLDFNGTEDEARRLVISLNVHRRHLHKVQLAVMAEEIYGKKADAMAAEALRQGRIQGGKLHASTVAISPQSNGSKQAPKRDAIVAELAKADGIVTTEYAVKGIQDVMKAPETLAQVKGGKYHKTRDAQAAALKELGKPLPAVPAEIKPRSTYERLGICIDNLNKILVDCDMRPGDKPEELEDRAKQVVTLATQVHHEMRKRKKT